MCDLCISDIEGSCVDSIEEGKRAVDTTLICDLQDSDSHLSAYTQLNQQRKTLEETNRRKQNKMCIKEEFGCNNNNLQTENNCH